MLEELEYNLWEHILQRLVDYGHAFSPEIEMAALNGDEAMLLHGEAVNIDMALTTQVSSSSAVCLLSMSGQCLCLSMQAECVCVTSRGDTLLPVKFCMWLATWLVMS